MQFREDGYLPEALLNYLVRLGWSHGDQEIFSIDEMIKLFDIKDVQRSAAAVNPDKLLWLNQHYIKTNDPARVAHQLSWHMGRLGIDPSQGPDLVDIVKAQRERARTLVEMAENSAFFYRDIERYNEKDAAKHLKPQIAEALQSLRDRLATLEDWTSEPIHGLIDEIANAHGLKLGKIAQPVRVAVAVSPPINITLALLGRERTLERLDAALTYISKHRAGAA